MPHVVIIGGGISGLALAYRLQQLSFDADITLLEERDRTGGTIWTKRTGGFQLELGPNGFLDTKPGTMQLCGDLGLADRLIAASEAARKNRYLLLDGKLQHLPSGFLAFLRSRVLSWPAKLSLLAERFRTRRPGDADESVDAFIRRRTSGEVAEILGDAFVTGIHAGDSTLLSARAAFPRLVELEQQHGSILKGFAASARQRRKEAAARGESPSRPGTMWSFREGLRVLIETVSSQLKTPPMTGVTVKRLSPQASGWTVHAEGKDAWTADAVALACPAHRQAVLLADVDPDLAELMSGIAYNRVAVVGLGYRQADVSMPLDGFGFLARQRDRGDLLGVQWCSSIYPMRAPEGAVLIRAMCGGWHRPELVGWDDGRLLEAVRRQVRATMGIEQPPIFHRIIRWDRAIPQYHIGHMERVARIENRVEHLPGLFVGGNAYHGVAMNDCTEQAGILASTIATYLRTRSHSKLGR